MVYDSGFTDVVFIENSRDSRVLYVVSTMALKSKFWSFLVSGRSSGSLVSDTWNLWVFLYLIVWDSQFASLVPIGNT